MSASFKVAFFATMQLVGIICVGASESPKTTTDILPFAIHFLRSVNVYVLIKGCAKKNVDSQNLFFGSPKKCLQLLLCFWVSKKSFRD